MNKSINNLQDIFLNNARKERIPVTNLFYLIVRKFLIIKYRKK